MNPRTLQRALLCVPVMGMLACSQAPASDEALTTDAALSTDAPGIGVAAGTVPLQPTAPGELPPSIIGQGGELLGQDVAYFDAVPETRGYLALPAGQGPFPALVIVHEWDGLKDRVRQVADDLAAEGYVVLAADLFGGQVGTNRDENMALVQAAQADMDGVVANLDAAVDYLRARDDVTGKVGAMGWCFGGGIALSYGLDGTHHEATAIFYGRLVDDPEALAVIDHEVYGTFARLDQGPSPEQVEAFETALREAGIDNDLHIYDEVNHGFWLRVDEDEATRAAPALDAWERLKAYLERSLGDG